MFVIEYDNPCGVVCPEGKYEVKISEQELISFIETEGVDCFFVPAYLSTMSLVMKLYKLRRERGYSYKILMLNVWKEGDSPQRCMAGNYAEEYAPFDEVWHVPTDDLLMFLILETHTILTTCRKVSRNARLMDIYRKNTRYCRRKYFSEFMKNIVPLPPIR